MNKISLSALLLACVAFLALPGVSQAEEAHYLQVLKKVKLLFQEILQDSTADSDSREIVKYMEEMVEFALYEKYFEKTEKKYIRKEVKALVRRRKFGKEATEKLKKVDELLGQLKY